MRLYIKGMAQRGKAVSMARLTKKLDEIIAVNEYAVFPGYAEISAKRAAADEHAKRQLEIWRTVNRHRLN